LSDFGAAAAYDRAADADLFENLEVRAFGKLLEDLVALCRDGPAAAHVREQLFALAAACSTSELARVPSFDAVGERLCDIGVAEE
jgi:predicted nuclease of restriction endonuclease-like RecB superfamily